MSTEERIVAEYSAVMASDGTLELPPEIREMWRLQAGDAIEFFQDHLGGWLMRPLTAGPLDFLECLPPRGRLPGVADDIDALGKAVVERNLPQSSARAAE